jgi:hypothetical protein
MALRTNTDIRTSQDLINEIEFLERHIDQKPTPGLKYKSREDLRKLFIARSLECAAAAYSA